MKEMAQYKTNNHGINVYEQLAKELYGTRSSYAKDSKDKINPIYDKNSRHRKYILFPIDDSNLDSSYRSIDDLAELYQGKGLQRGNSFMQSVYPWQGLQGFGYGQGNNLQNNMMQDNMYRLMQAFLQYFMSNIMSRTTDSFTDRNPRAYGPFFMYASTPDETIAIAYQRNGKQDNSGKQGSGKKS